MIRHAPRPARLAPAVLLTLAAVCAAEVPVEGRWQTAEDGHSVTDLRTRLVWSRCVEGMDWNGKTCVGRALALELPQAQARARERAARDGLRWRLPHITELQRLLPAFEARDEAGAPWFPVAPATWHWTASVTVDSRPVNPYRYDNVERGMSADNTNRIAFLHGWALHTGTREVNAEMPRRQRLSVRLVRPMR